MSEKDKFISIPVKPHLKKFILKRYGQVEPLQVAENSVIGKHIMSMLIDKRDFENSNDEYSDIIQLQLSQAMYKRSPRIKNLIRINYYLENDFKEALFIWVHAKIDSGINPYNATREFVEFYNFSPTEYTHDAAQRAWLRHKNGEYERRKKQGGQRHKIGLVVS